MEKKSRKSKRRRMFGLTMGELSVIGTFVVSTVAFVVAGVRYFDRRFDSIDRKFEIIDGRLDRIESELKQTSSLLNVYLTWRFLYVNDPTRKNLTPRYDPNARTLELVDKNNKVIK